MKTISAIVLAVGLFAAVGKAQPVITQVSNAASFSLQPLPNSSIAQGSFFAIFGTGLGAATSDCGANLVDCIWKPYPLPTNIKGASVTVTVGSTTVPAYLYFAIATQINAVLPSTTPTGTGTVTVSFNGKTATSPITVVAGSFGAFTINQGGSGPGIITDAGFVMNSLTHTAKPGDEMILFGTGLGPSPDPSTEGTAGPCPQGCNFLTANPNLVTVWVGTQKVVPDYAGRSQYTAEDEIYFKVPTSASVQGCYVQVAVQVSPSGGTPAISNFSSLAVDPNGAACSDKDGINVSDLTPALSSKGSANVAAISLLSNFLNLSIPGLADLQWDNDTVTGNVGTFTTGVLNEFQGFTLSASVNNCTVSAFQGYPPPSDPALKAETYLDAGSALSAQGGGVTMAVPKNSNGQGYGGLVGGSSITNLLNGSGLAPMFLTPTFGYAAGNFTVTAPGGSTVGAFSATANVSSDAAAFKWTNENTVASGIDRSQPLTITWTGGDPNGFVDITAISSTAGASGPVSPKNGLPGSAGNLAECLVPASAGTFTIPTFVLQALPPTVLNASGGSASLIPTGELLVGPASGATKVSPTPTGLDAAYIFYHFIQGQNVIWK